MPELPTGTVTFLFTDIEGSTRLLAEAGDDYARLLDEHRRLVRDAVEGRGGVVFGTEGDAVFAVFDRAPAAIAAAAEVERALDQHAWPEGVQIRVRAGVHSGDVALGDGGYVGLAIHEVARIAAAAHGGQVLVSSSTRELAADSRLPSFQLRDLGEHRLKDISHPVRLYQLTGEGLPDDFPPPRSLLSRPHTVPEQLTSFVGREELTEGRRLLGRTRLLTLTGPGGTGKTRLAVELAAAARDEFPGGAFFVPLDSVRDASLVASALVSGLGLPATTGSTASPLQRAVEYLRDRAALLVLDNFEQVVDAAPVVAQLLREAPAIRVIATSRVPLRLSGEQDLPIPPLAVPDDGRPDRDRALRSEAVRLFAERAGAARPDFRLDEANTATVVDVVRRLDGLPLAIELAAARLRVLSVEALRDRLDRRLSLLTGGARDLPARQQTLRGAIEWSYDLLEPPDRDLFERFGVFAGGACLAEAEPICGPAAELGEDVFDGLASLTEKSLLRPVPRAIDDPRFAMLATIREYAVDRLVARPDAGILRRRHAETYVALVERCAPHLFGRQRKRLLDRLEQDHDNLRLALDWALDQGESRFALRFLAGIWRFWQARGHLREGLGWAQRILALPGVKDEPAAVRARALAAAGGIAYWRGDGIAAHDFYREALALARESGDRALLAEALNNFGFTPERSASIGLMSHLGRPFLAESAALYRELGDRDGLAQVTWALAGGHISAGQFEEGRRLVEESLGLFRETDNQWGVGWALFILAQVNFRAGRLDLLLDHAAEALGVFSDTGDLSGIVMCLFGLSLVARQVGEREAEWRLAGASDALSKRLDVAIDIDVLRQVGIEPPQRPAGDPDAERLWDEGAAMTVDDAVSYAFDVIAIASAAARTAGR